MLTDRIGGKKSVILRIFEALPRAVPPSCPFAAVPVVEGCLKAAELLADCWVGEALGEAWGWFATEASTSVTVCIDGSLTWTSSGGAPCVWFSVDIRVE